MSMYVNMVDPGAAAPAGTGPPAGGHGGADFVLLLQQLLGASGRDREGSQGGAAGLAAGLSGEDAAADAPDLPGTVGGDLVGWLAALLAAPGGWELLTSWAGQDGAGQLAGLVAQDGGDGERVALAWGRWLESNPRLAAYLEQLVAVLARRASGGVVPVTGAGGEGQAAPAASGRAFMLAGDQAALTPQAGARAGALLAGVSQGVASKGAGAQPGGTLAAGGPPRGPEAAKTFVTATWSGNPGLPGGEQAGPGIRQVASPNRAGARPGEFGDLPLAAGQLAGASPLPGPETAVVGWPKAMDFVFTWLVQRGQLIKEGQRTALELHLRPEALGVLRLEVISEGGRLLGHLLVQNQAAHQWVQSNLTQLQQDLNQQGLHFDEFRVDVAGGGIDSGGPAQQQPFAGSGEGAAAGQRGDAGGMAPESQPPPGAGAAPVGLIDYLV